MELLKGESTLVETMNASSAAGEIIGASLSVLHTASADLESHIDSLKRDISPSHAHSTSRRKWSDTQQELALLVEKLKVLADAAQMIQSETGGAEGQTTARISGIIMKFSADTDEDPFVKVKSLVMSLISRLHDESLSLASQKAWCNEEMSNATGKREDLEADTAKCSSSLETDLAHSTVSSLRFSQSWVCCQTDNCRWASCAQSRGTFSPKSKLTLGKAFRECRRHLRPFGTI